MAEAAKAGCLDVEALAAHLHGQGTPEERRTREMHLNDCASCSTEFALLREFLEAEPTPVERADVEWISERLAPPGPSAEPEHAKSWLDRFADFLRGDRWAWAGAAVALAAAVSFVALDRPPELPGGLGQGPMIVRSGQLRAIAPSGAVDAAPAELVVEAAPEAAAYRFELREVDRRVIWTSQTSEPRVDLPANVAEYFLRGKTLVWTAAALSESGEVLAESPPTRFNVISPESVQ